MHYSRKGDNFIDASKFTGSATLNGGDGSDILWGGSGNDLLNGGNGADWLSGGAGDDQLNGGANRDILVGGLGRDVLYGATASTNESAENILIGGSTLQDNSKPANQALLLTWSSSNLLQQRLTTIQSAGFKLNKNTVANDNSIDSLIGSDGFDWFLLQTTAINADIHNADAQEKARWLTW